MDVLSQDLAEELNDMTVDLVTSNPPYITDWSQVERSVKLFEPKLALEGDTEFYHAIFKHSIKMNAKAIVFELGNESQLKYLQNMATDLNWNCTDGILDSANNLRAVALWRDEKWSFLSNFSFLRQ